MSQQWARNEHADNCRVARARATNRRSLPIEFLPLQRLPTFNLPGISLNCRRCSGWRGTRLVGERAPRHHFLPQALLSTHPRLEKTMDALKREQCLQGEGGARARPGLRCFQVNGESRVGGVRARSPPPPHPPQEANRRREPSRGFRRLRGFLVGGGRRAPHLPPGSAPTGEKVSGGARAYPPPRDRSNGNPGWWSGVEGVERAHPPPRPPFHARRAPPPTFHLPPARFLEPREPHLRWIGSRVEGSRA